MGLLDDAIREHLELKRRRGADPSELERAEQEALGPVRRRPVERGDEFEDHLAHERTDVADEHEYSTGSEEYDDVVNPDHRVTLGEDESLVARGNGEAARGINEAEYEEYYEEEYYDDEEGGEWDEPFPEEAAPRRGYEPAARESTLEAGGRDRAAPAAAPRASVPPESAPPTQAASPEPDATELDEETVEYDVEDELRTRGRRSRREPERQREPSPGQGEDVLEETPEFLQDAPEHDRLWFEQRPPRDFDFDS
jgi:hypothetical protein